MPLPEDAAGDAGARRVPRQRRGGAGWARAEGQAPRDCSLGPKLWGELPSTPRRLLSGGSQPGTAICHHGTPRKTSCGLQAAIALDAGCCGDGEGSQLPLRDGLPGPTGAAPHPGSTADRGERLPTAGSLGGGPAPRVTTRGGELPGVPISCGSNAPAAAHPQLPSPHRLPRRRRRLGYPSPSATLFDVAAFRDVSFVELKHRYYFSDTSVQQRTCRSQSRSEMGFYCSTAFSLPLAPEEKDRK